MAHRGRGPVELVEHAVQRTKRESLGDVVDEQRTNGTAVVCACDRAVPLLAGCEATGEIKRARGI